MTGMGVSATAAGGPLESTAFPPEGVDFERVMAETEKRYLKAALEKADGVRTRAAEFLKISYRSFRHYSKKHDL
jgi:two-component system, NtrC family, response regulator PilR